MADQKLKIATWNLDRPTFSSTRKNKAILTELRKVDADILVLTETNSCIDLSDTYETCFATTCLFVSLAIGNEKYEQGENRVTIWSKLPGQRRIDICNSHSAICAQLRTDWGELNVYGTVIGIYGKHRFKSEPASLPRNDFETALEVQLADWERLAKLGHLCIAGDFNLTLGDNTYVNKEHRQRIFDHLRKLAIDVPTGKLLRNVDQIAISHSFLNSIHCKPDPWHESRNKKISDHQGVSLTLEKA